jgi:peptide/nickel transport system permease protein
MANIKYYLRRTARVPLTIIGVLALTFGLIRLLPGGPYTQLRLRLLRRGLSQEQVQAQIQTLMSMRPDAPLWQQLISYIVSFLTGDLGRSISYNEPVASIIARALPWTVFLVLSSLALMFVFGVVIGAFMAYWEGSVFDKSSSGISIFTMSIPYFIYAVLFVWLFGYVWGLFPTSGAVAREVEAGLNINYIISVLYHAALPIISFTIPQVGSWALSMRGNSIQVLGEDYIEVGRLRGLSDSRLATRYVAQNAILPMYTGLLLLIGFRLGGTVVLETIFSYPGIGYYMIQAVNANDYPLMMGCFAVITITVVVAVYVADMTYGLIDPRISAGESDAY